MMNDSSGMQNGLRGQSEINNTDGPSAQTLFNTIIRAVRDALQEIHLTYDNINAFDASIEVGSLQENPLFESVCPRLVLYPPLLPCLTESRYGQAIKQMRRYECLYYVELQRYLFPRRLI